MLKTYARSSLEQVDALLQSAIRTIRTGSHLPGPFVALQVTRGNEEFQVQLVFENPNKKDIQEFAKEDILPELKIGLEEYPTSILKTSLAGFSEC